MQGSEQLSVSEITSELSTYRAQLKQVRRYLEDDPGNSEYADMAKELEEVIVLTEELLEAAKQGEIPALNIGNNNSASPSQHLSNETSEHFERFPVGTKVEAVWSEDGEWYEATIESHTPNGYFVTYNEWGNKEEVDPANVRAIEEGVVDTLRVAEKEAEATKQALKRKISQAADVGFQARVIPAKLLAQPDDPEDVKVAKRKKLHAFKSKIRFEKLEVTQNKRQNDWQQFQTTKGRTKKAGFFSGRKRESIFKSPDDPRGKVGVTGSGKGLTDFQKREKHLHPKAGGGADNEEE